MLNKVDNLKSDKLSAKKGHGLFVIVLLALTIVLIGCLSLITWVAVGPYFGAGHGSGLTPNMQHLLDTVEKSSAALGATIGIAAAIAGAFVTIYLANLAFDIASRTTEIARNEQRRESEKYARELKVELVQYQRRFAEILNSLNELGRDLAIYSPNYSLFQSWLVLQGRKCESGQIWAEDGGLDCIDHRRDASAILEILLDASKHAVSPHHDHDEESTDKMRNVFLEVARIIDSNIKENQTFRSLTEALGISRDISRLRSSILPVLKEFDATLGDVDQLGFVSDAMMSDEDGERSCQFLRSRVRALIRLIDDDDMLFLVAGAAEDWTQLLLNDIGLVFDGNNRMGPLETLYAVTAYSLLGVSLPTDQASSLSAADAYKAARGIAAIVSAVARPRDDLMRIFSLEVDGKDAYIPRPLMSYLPSSQLTNYIEVTDWIVPKIEKAEVKVRNALGLELADECNPYSALERLAQRRSDNARHRMGMRATQ